jgi:hypothetical protein
MGGTEQVAVAVIAEQAPDGTRLVVMVYGQALCAWLLAANGAGSLLLGKKGFVILNGNTEAFAGSP